jgi:16S rRNA (guanine527-N7)-methyltransferase
MQTKDVESYLAKGIDLMDLSLDNRSAALERLILYFHELKKWNKKVNLVARTLDERQILENHFLDSLSLLSILDPENKNPETVMDVGSGAGFPGMVLKAACPLLPVVLIEPRKNRYYFLKHVARILGLKDVDLLNVRLDNSEEAEKFAGRKFSLITSRAFTDMREFFMISKRYLAFGGRIVCMKGPDVDKELREIENDDLLKGSYGMETKKLQLPYSKAERVLVIIKELGS